MSVESAAKSRTLQSPPAEQLDYTELIATSSVGVFFLLQLLFYMLKNI